MRGLNLAAAICVHAIVGFMFIGLAENLSDSPGDFGSSLAAVLWVAGLVLMIAWRNSAPGRIWLVPLLWPIAGWFAGLGIVVLGGLVYWYGFHRRGEATSARRAPARPGEFRRQLGLVDATARSLEQQVREAIALARAAPSAAVVPAAVAAAPVRVGQVRTFPAPGAKPTAAKKPQKPPKPPREIDWSIFLGARALAWAGGLVMILGIVFFFVLAANRGWLTPEIRVGLGSATSAATFCAGLWLKRRFGHLYSALAAVSAGIAGAYATLLAATALYEFLPQSWALVAAAAIASVGVAVSLAWKAQTVAVMGLLGAMLVPFMLLVDEGKLSFIGTSFVAIVFAATSVVAQRMRWRELLLAGGAASLVQIALLIAETNALTLRIVVLAAIFWLLYGTVGVIWQLRFGAGRLEPVAGALIVTGAALATYASAYLFEGRALGVHQEGLALLGAGAAHGVLAAVFFSRRALRDLSSLLWTISLTLGAVAAAELVTGPSLTVVWAVVAVLLVWLAERTGEARLRLPAAAYLLLAIGDAVAVEAPPRDLFLAVTHPVEGAASALAVAAALLVFARYARGRIPAEEAAGPFSRWLELLAGWVGRLREVYLWAAGAFALYAASLGILEFSAWIRVEDLEIRFARGQVAVHGLWAAVAFALVELGLRRRRLHLEYGGAVLGVFTVLSALMFAVPELPATERSLIFLAVAAPTLLAGLEYGRLASWSRRLLPAGGAIVVSAALGAAGLVALAHGDWHRIAAEGGALVGLGLLYAAFSASVFRTQRDLSSLLWALALALSIAGLGELLSGRWLVLAGACLCAGLALLSRRTSEARLQGASAFVFGLALAYCLWVEAPPRALFVALAHPGVGVPALLFLAAAAGVFAWTPELLRYARPLGLGVFGAVLFYAVSLAILEIAEIATQADIETKFQRGHTGVSAFWGLVSLAALYLGLTRRSRALRLGGFGLFGVTLAKIFLYDLSFLSSLTRALSFVVVGGVLLLAGFFYQRLSEQLEERDRTGAPGAPPGNAAA